MSDDLTPLEILAVYDTRLFQYKEAKNVLSGLRDKGLDSEDDMTISRAEIILMARIADTETKIQEIEEGMR